MKILVTGANGQLGHDLVNELNRRNHFVIPCGHAELDVCSPEQVRSVIMQLKPDAVIHCAAYTAVDKAEDEAEKCFQVNAFGTENVSRACAEIGAKLMYLSTDYVFDGAGDAQWETYDKPAPLNVYGMSKLDGEKAVQNNTNRHFIVRISWVFGIAGKNFVKTMLRLGKEKDIINVVNDQVGAPTYTADLAVLLADMIETEKYGVYHASNENFCSWAEFASAIMKKAKLPAKIVNISSEEYPVRARRPLNSRLNKDKLSQMGFKRLPTWEDALDRFLAELGEIDG